MNRFSIRDIEKLTGIKAHTLRVWEQRYQYDFSKRKEGGHRYYDGEDLKKILRLSILYKRGNKISSLLEIDQEQLASYCMQDLNAGVYAEPFRQLLEAVSNFDEETFNQVVHLQILHIGLQKTMLEIIFPLLNLIGNNWLCDRVIPAQEHFCSSLVMKKLLLAIDGLETENAENARTVLLFTPIGESHEIPILFMHYLLKKNGSKCVYYGKNANLHVLKDICEVHHPSHLFFHLITHLDDRPLENYLQELLYHFPDKKIVAAGPALQNQSLPSHPSFTWLKDCEAMLKFSAADQVNSLAPHY
ncbi:MerR family transcriptional regulator [Flavihumibacter cheonanensis]|uniref:MerR family transcriptional regulator n=1 Tax=Flavihumibacter cheonanensis TaxID=1442385 RepID=UPI001EF7887E|nr:MerR family transcriptional regulator [Flavihumibacter cheonanensis]MCG7751571.1 MerR family transcriptional regulator [Flavihumibacter cheonanensis]